MNTEAKETKVDLNTLTSRVIGAAITVHKELGPGLMESVYQKCLAIELQEEGFGVELEVPVPLRYRGRDISDEALRIDMVIEDHIVVELKSVAEVLPVHKKQLLTYLKLSGKPLGLLINFNEVMLKDGITRITTLPQGETGCTDSSFSTKQCKNKFSLPARRLVLRSPMGEEGSNGQTGAKAG